MLMIPNKLINFIYFYRYQLIPVKILNYSNIKLFKYYIIKIIKIIKKCKN